jgi:hypothetical protein
MSKRHEMFDRMPEEFPPKRLMRNVEQMRGQMRESCVTSQVR